MQQVITQKRVSYLSLPWYGLILCVERKPQRHVLGIHLSGVFVKLLHFWGIEVSFFSLSTDLFSKILLSWINQRTTRDEEHEFYEDKSHRATLHRGRVAAGTT